MSATTNTFSDGPEFHSVWEQVRRLTSLTSQHELAQALGIADSAVTDAKKRGYFPLYWAYRLAKSYHLSLDEILFAEDPPKTSPPLDTGKLVYIDSAVQLVEEAIRVSGQHINERQKHALIDIVREEMKTKTVRMVKALKE